VLRGFASVPLTGASAKHRAKPIGNVRLWRLSKRFRERFGPPASTLDGGKPLVLDVLDAAGPDAIDPLKVVKVAVGALVDQFLAA
jgi:hypothetical protein